MAYSNNTDNHPEKATMQSHSRRALLGWIIVILGMGGGMAFFFGPDPWFRELAKPIWNPPDWVFAPIWTILYVMIAVSLWLVRCDTSVPRAEQKSALRLFWWQFALNLAWTPIFFGLHSPALAFIEICVLWLVALWTALRFGKISSTAGYLLVPYLLWLSIALVLNGTIWLLNG